MSNDAIKYSILGNCNIQHAETSLVAQLEIIHLIQLRYAFRISEVLNLNNSSLHDDFNVCVKLSKCSDFFFFRDEEIWCNLSTIFSSTENHSFTASYKEYYNYLRKYFPHETIKSLSKNNRVTHAYRYSRLKRLKASTSNPKVFQANLRHKSVRSQEAYLKLK